MREFWENQKPIPDFGKICDSVEQALAKEVPQVLDDLRAHLRNIEEAAENELKRVTGGNLPLDSEGAGRQLDRMRELARRLREVIRAEEKRRAVN